MTWQPIGEGARGLFYMDQIRSWEDKVDEIRKTYKFNEDFNLAECLRKLITLSDFRDAFIDEICRQVSDLKSIKSALKKAEEALKHLEQVSTITQSKLELDEIFISPKVLIQKLDKYVKSSYLWTKGKKYKRSKPRQYINRLIGIFHEGTGKIPECICNRENEYIDDDFYSGEFYTFLIKIKPLLYVVGVELPKDQTIGKYAYQHINGYLENDIRHPSYIEVLAYFESGEFERIKPSS